MYKKRVALGLSGGVDSAVSAYLFKRQGYDVTGVYLDCFRSDIPGCRGDRDRKDALAVAMKLKIPFQVLDFKKEYQSAVIDYFKSEYLAGRTPNPDVVCNREIKFGLFYEWAMKKGFDYVATGHYARLVTSDKQQATSKRKQGFLSPVACRLSLARPSDERKDQTYFLWQVPRERFKRVLFPLGDYLKVEVREIARAAGLPVADKPDSTGICFVGEVRVEDFLKRLGVKEKEGEVLIRRQVMSSRFSVISSEFTSYQSAGLKLENRKLVDSKPKTENRKPITEDVVVGTHRGVWFYTVGQRHGFEVHAKLKMQNEKFTDKPPLYVVEKDIENNRLMVGFGAGTYCSSFTLGNCNWLISEKVRPWRTPRSDLNRYDCLVRIRHGGELVPAKLEPINGSTHQRINAFLSIPQRGIAAGQSAVFYSKLGIVLGGGVIQ